MVPGSTTLGRLPIGGPGIITVHSLLDQATGSTGSGLVSPRTDYHDGIGGVGLPLVGLSHELAGDGGGRRPSGEH